MVVLTVSIRVLSSVVEIKLINVDIIVVGYVKVIVELSIFVVVVVTREVDRLV
jgi:hypothetical protein